MNAVTHAHLSIKENDLAHYFAEISPAMLLAVNAEREILYANARMLDFIGAPNFAAVKGKRFGEVKDQVFVRAFSTKGKGRGVGTYSVKLFTEQYLKGNVWFTSAEGQGTSFFVKIPNAKS